MRLHRSLAEDVWYYVWTSINNGETLFRLPWVKALLVKVLNEAKGFFPFEIRGLKIEGGTLSFYIKPANGFRLPQIMQWLKQTFTARFNALTDRTGHIWGDRYGSRILDGEPPEEAKAVDWDAIEGWAARVRLPPPEKRAKMSGGVSPRPVGKAAESRSSPEPRPDPASPPG